MRIRSMLTLAVSAVAVAALATPAQAADDGTYLIRDVRSGQCLAGGEGPLGGHVEPCNPGTVWQIHNQGDGLAQIVESNGAGRCLALSPLKIYPAPVWVNQCGGWADQWSILGPANDGTVAIALGQGEYGYLTTQSSRVVVNYDGGYEWVLERIG
ncbi:hypothetical protein [Streptomyces sp. NPDC002785]|uniref:RICIN domain-containing protein n=1 Tax=Streptomyces sp. NPDC002785 TaxID=3154543 RepID=UPI0033306B07